MPGFWFTLPINEPVPGVAYHHVALPGVIAGAIITVEFAVHPVSVTVVPVVPVSMKNVPTLTCVIVVPLSVNLTPPFSFAPSPKDVELANVTPLLNVVAPLTVVAPLMVFVPLSFVAPERFAAPVTFVVPIKVVVPS